MTHRGAGIKMAEWENMEITSPYKHIKHLPVEQFSEFSEMFFQGYNPQLWLKQNFGILS